MGVDEVLEGMRFNTFLDRIFVLGVAILCILIPLKYLSPEVSVIMDGTKNTLYALICPIFIIITSLQFVKNLKGRSCKTKMELLGFGSDQFAIQLIVGISLGVLGGLVTLYLHSLLLHKALVPTNIGILLTAPLPMLLDLFLVNLCLGPITEEFVYRRLMISRFLMISPSHISVILALVASSLVFAYTHSSFPEIKIIWGAIYGSLYLWKRSLFAPISAHIAFNTVVTLLLME